LDDTMGGLPVSATVWPFTHRRTVYSFIDRVRLPNDFRNFDFASPDAHMAERYLTTTPQQALYLMNSPFVTEQAVALNKRSQLASEKNPRRRIQQLYRLIYGRAPKREEIALGLEYLRGSGAGDSHSEREAVGAKNGPWVYGQGEYDEK